MYHLGSLKLHITGTVTLDPQFEQLLFDDHICIRIRNGGRLNLGLLSQLNPDKPYQTLTPGPAIISTQDDGNWDQAEFIWVDSGGHLEWIGAYVRSRCGMRFRNGSTVNITEGVFECNGRSILAGRENRGNAIWIESAGVTINSWRILGGAELIVFAQRVSTLSGLTIEAAASATAINVNLENSTPLTLIDIDFGGRGNGTDIPLSGGRSVHAVNSSTGTALEINGIEVVYEESNWGYTRISKELYVEVEDANGAVEGARVYVRDTDNGQRKNLSGHDDTQDKVTLLTTQSDGRTSVAPIITGIVNVAGSNPIGTPNVAPYDVDLRGKTNVLGEDVFDLHVWSYAHAYSVREVALKGTGVDVHRFTLVADSLISGTSAEAAAYTVLNTPQQVYNRCKWWKVSDPGNLPSIGELPLTRTGDTLTTTYNVVIGQDSNMEVFAFDGSTITFRSDGFTGNITTTGTVTLQDGVTVTGSILDATGDSVISVTVPAGYDHSVSVFGSKSDAEAQTNVINTGSSFRYLASGYGGQTVWYRLVQTDGSYIIENYTLPIDSGIYNVELLVTSTETTLISIKATTDKLSSMLEASGSNYRFTADAISQTGSGGGGNIDISTLATTEQLTAAKDAIITASLPPSD